MCSCIHEPLPPIARPRKSTAEAGGGGNGTGGAVDADVVPSSDSQADEPSEVDGEEMEMADLEEELDLDGVAESDLDGERRD